MTLEQLEGMAKRLKERRKELGYTQEQAAEKIGITYSSYSKIENAFQSPSLELTIKIAEVYGLSLDYLVFGDSARRSVRLSENANEAIREVADILKQLVE